MLSKIQNFALFRNMARVGVPLNTLWETLVYTAFHQVSDCLSDCDPELPDTCESII